MNQEIAITRTAESRLEGLDFDALPFGKVFSDHMFVVDFVGGRWQDARIVPYGPMSIEPSNMALHYGQAVFEGMKATKTADGRAMLWRPEQHSRRINASARRLAMPELPESMFLAGLNRLVDLDKGWVPPAEGSALYIRPFMFATDCSVGVRPSTTYRFVIFTCPVGPYYTKPVKLIAETHYVRAVAGGVGEAKAAGNYAAAMLPALIAQQKGYDQVLWLDAKEFKYIQEVGTMNIFFVIDGTVVTPATTGAILRGITRNSMLHFLEEAGYPVETRPLSIDEVVAAHKAGTLSEVFGTGTAAVVSHVESILYLDYEITLPPVAEREVGPWLKNQINGIRSARIPDSHGWLVEAGSPEALHRKPVAEAAAAPLAAATAVQ